MQLARNVATLVLLCLHKRSLKLIPTDSQLKVLTYSGVLLQHFVWLICAIGFFLFVVLLLVDSTCLMKTINMKTKVMILGHFGKFMHFLQKS